MKLISVPVKKGKPPIVLDIINVPKYESVEEAINSLGESHWLCLINKMLKREITQDIRNNSKEKSTANKLKSMGISLEDVQRELLKMQNYNEKDEEDEEDNI